MSDNVYSLSEIKKLIYEYKEELEREYNAVNFFVFGSYAKGEQMPDSDIDILVELKSPLGLKFFGLEKFLEKILGKKVDLGTPDSIKPAIKNKILSEAVKL